MSQPPVSFDLLVERHRPELLAYLVRLIGNMHDAEDVCQDSFLRAYRSFARLATNSNSRAWLYRIVTNTAFNFLKRRKRTAARSIYMNLETLQCDSVAAGIQKEQIRRVARAVGALPSKQRAALMQRQFQGLSYQEIATSLGCTVESARANVYQALKKLRKSIGDP